MLKNSHFFQDHLLISMPHLNDDNFSETVTYICCHDKQGAMGIVINRPVGLTLTDLCNHLGLHCPLNLNLSQTIFNGGPVQADRGCVLHAADTQIDWQGHHVISDEVHLSTSLDAIEAAVEGRFQDNYLIALGCAGWAPGQLEQEISDNVWLSCPANSDILFNIPVEDRLQAAAATLGVNLNLLTAHSGHA